MLDLQEEAFDEIALAPRHARLIFASSSAVPGALFAAKDV
jgi:hypothetical protein